ncbi:putative Branched-chain-amino-acid transaminase 1 [Blattamonas nauphoetae]|uniref:Branched-chain-amino-acid aminotransferase n=1 Tax=Blattamonas nauphoetae TaxID=2049346 RepID=A0ABQ9Y6E6_9EUKA|nr:putative Branched-chain-amino-acid transaminase 1 [Blattamonas nauphoetae]
MEFKYELVPEAERNPVIQDVLKVPFGKVFTDHMFVMHYRNGAWEQGAITKLAPLPVHPGSIVLHYGQELFEGAKCFKMKNGKFGLFRIDQNIARLNNGCRKLKMPEVPAEVQDKAIRELIKVDQRHIPTQDGCSLYIRPFIFGDEAGLGVRPSSSYTYCVLLCPVGAYYPEGFKPTKIYSDDIYARSADRGTGDVKCGGNYAASLGGGALAHQHGCSQFLWLDGQHHKYVEEVGAMNVFFVKNGIAYTCPLNGTILPGITRKSAIELLKDSGIEVREEALAIDDVVASIQNGTLTEIFGTGTAASVCPVSELKFKETNCVLNKGTPLEGKIGPITQKLYDLIIGIQRGTVEDKKGWISYVE